VVTRIVAASPVAASACASSRAATACAAGSIRAASAAGSAGAGVLAGSPSGSATRTTGPLARPGLTATPVSEEPTTDPAGAAALSDMV